MDIHKGDRAGRILGRSTDVFDKLIADGVSNELDIPAHYQYSPERWRLSRDGSRQFPEYTSVTGFTDNEDHFLLEPAQGETLAMETAERPRYTVQFELLDTFALQLGRQMETDDHFRAGMFDGNDGWFFEKNDTHGELEIDLVTFRQGSEVNRKSATLGKALTDGQTRLSIRSPWYDIGRQIFGQSFSRNGYQQNEEVGRTSLDSSRGPETGNLPIRMEIKRGSSSSALDLEVGSVGVVTLGATQGISRTKEFVKSVNVDTSGSWIPIFAMRNDPDQDVVNSQLLRIEMTQFTGNGNIEMIARSFAPEHVADSGGNQLVDGDFGSPDEIHTQSSAMQTTEAVDQVADSSGTLQTSMTDPGGHQLGFSELTADKKATSPSSSPQSRASISARDIIVIMVEADATGDVRWITSIEEDW